MSGRSRFVGINSLAFGAAVSKTTSEARKRPLTPTVPANTTKRPKTGPFLVGSDSESDEESDSDDGFSYDGHISATPKLPQRSDGNDVQMVDTGSNSIAPTKASFQQQTPSRTPAPRISNPKTASVLLPGKELTKNRLMMLVAKKQGGPGARELAKQNAPLSMGRAGADTRSRPMNGIHAGTFPQKQPAVAGAEDKVIATTNPRLDPTLSATNGITRNIDHSMSRNIQGPWANQDTQRKRPDPPPRLAEQPTPKFDKVSQAARAPVNKPASLSNLNSLPRTQQTSDSRSPNSSTPQTANAARPQNAANSSSLRNILDTAKAGHHTATKDRESVRNEWQKAKTKRISTKAAKNVQGPEVGARYGHTLTARKSGDAGKGLEAVRGGSTNANPLQTQESKGQAPTQASSLVSPKLQKQGDSRRHSRTSNNLPINQPSPTSLGQSARLDESGGPLNRIPCPASSRDESHAIPSVATEQPQPGFLANVNKQEYSTPSAYSGLLNPPSTNKIVTEAIIISEQSTARNDARSTNSTGVCNTATNPSERTQTSQASFETTAKTPGTPVQKLAQHDRSRDIAARTPSVLPTDTAMSEPSVQEQVPKATVVLPENTMNLSNSPTGPADGGMPSRTDVLSVCLESQTTPSLEASKSRAPSVEYCIHPEIPVAVMVRPDREGHPDSVPTGDTYDAGSEPTRTMNTRPGSRNASPSFYSGWQGSIKESNASTKTSTGTAVCSVPESGTENAALNISEPTDVCVDRHVSPIAGGAAQLASPTPVAGGHPQQLPVATPESISSVPGNLMPAVATAPRVEHSAAPLKPTEEIVQLIASANLLSSQATTIDLSSQAILTPNTQKNTEVTPDTLPVPISAAQASALTLPAEITLPSPTNSATVESYFEYTIHQTLSSLSSDAATTELSVQPFTSADVANAQSGKLFETAKQQFECLQIHCKSAASKTSEHGMKIHEGVFENIEDPSNTFSLKIWTERNVVGTHAALTSSNIQPTPLLSRTAFALRLWRLIDAPTSSNTSDGESDSDNDDDDHEANKENIKEQLRIYHPLPNICTEIHTTLDAANRAAKRVQVALSHEKEPRNVLQKQWQGQNLRELNAKVDELMREVDSTGDGASDAPSLFEFEEGRRKGCWRSTFNGCGLGADRFELLVSRVGLSGPRNL